MGRDKVQRIITDYPWLDVGIENLTLLDMLPIGWHNLLLSMCKELRVALIEYDLLSQYEVYEAKEKYCMLRWYDGLKWDCDINMPQSITDIVCRYEELSKEVCMICGAFKPKNQELCDVCMEQYG